MKIKTRQSTYLFLVYLLAMACTLPKKTMDTQPKTTTLNADTNAKPTSPNDTAATQSIVFYTIELETNRERSSYKATLVNNQKRNGVLKNDYDTSVVLKPNYVLCQFLDQSNQLLKQAVLANPLEPHYEYSNENGDLESVRFRNTKGKLFIRTQFDPNITSINVYLIYKNKPLKLISNVIVSN